VASAVLDELEVGGEGEAVAVPGAEPVQGEDGHVPRRVAGPPLPRGPDSKGSARRRSRRARLLAQPRDIADVGYDSPSQFSREYRRMFGAPPGRDTARLRHP